MAETGAPSESEPSNSGQAHRFDIERSDALDGVPHGFFGSSTGHQFGYGGPGDTDETRLIRAVAASAILSGAPMAAPLQVHSPEVVTVGRLWPDAPEGRPVADGVVTARTDVVLGIVTADCCPILFADKKAGIVGAAHAGWRGACGNERGNVLENTVAAMEALGANRAAITAVLGPTIAQASYEVDAAFREHFKPEDDAHFAEAPEREGVARWHFNLPAYVVAQLRRCGLVDIADIARDTFANPIQYHSYRRASMGGEPNYGRQISAIAVP
ncbi:peptidoglycan editing factor PgeF [Erythrobacter sp. Alg231-14]|uniref:peptidoglycan editing factor PgeF n=1 Tax=Erythrobacter sp. Alg231-14 TaxID=1922225 RepID=UPI000D55E9F2